MLADSLLVRVIRQAHLQMTNVSRGQRSCFAAAHTPGAVVVMQPSIQLLHNSNRRRRVCREKGFNLVVRDVCCSAIIKGEEIVNAVVGDFLFS
jgi:hypothetical protein